jgi:DNA-binding CsgD family transcriptional regulator
VAYDTFLAGVHAVLDLEDDDRVLRRAVLDRIRRTVPFDAYAWLLTDPETTVGTAPLADVPGQAQLPHLVTLRYTSGRRWSTCECGVPYDPVRPGSQFDQFFANLGPYDIVSLVFADRFGCWGFLDLWRKARPFDEAELAILGLLGQPVTLALRRSVAASFLEPEARVGGPSIRSVLLLDHDLSLREQTPEAEDALRCLLPTEQSRQPVPAAAYNVASQLLAVEAGIDAHPPRARALAAPGRWISLEAARLGDGIAVTIGPIEQSERCSLFCRAYGLSARETDVVVRLAEGHDTRAVGEGLHVSRHTVQDHLKSVFDKTGVRSRRELLARMRGW